MIFIGIDPGKKGAFAIIDEQSKHLDIVDKATIQDFVSILKPYNKEPVFAIIEESNLPMIFNPGIRAFTPPKGSQEYSRQVGMWKGALLALAISHEVVKPQKWQKAILGLVPKNKTKEYSISFAQKKWPFLNIKSSQDGVADALCIAEYARRIHSSVLV